MYFAKRVALPYMIGFSATAFMMPETQFTRLAF